MVNGITAAQARQQITEAQRQIQEQQRQVEQARLRKPTPTELRARTRPGLTQRQLQEQQLEAQKVEARRQLEVQQKEVRQFEQRVQTAEQQQQSATQFNTALRVFLGIQQRPPGFEGIPLSVRREAQRQAEGIEKATTTRVVSGIPGGAIGTAVGGGFLFPTEGPQTIPLLSTREELTKIQQQSFKEFVTPVVRTLAFGPQVDLERTATQKSISDFGRTIQSKLEKGKIAVLSAVDPSFRQELNKQKSEASKIDTDFKSLDKKIENFNQRFGDKDLDPSQFESAARQQESLIKDIGQFNTLLEETKINQAKRLAEKQDLPGGVEAFGLGVLSSPFTLASFGTGLLTTPEEAERVFTGITQLPAQIGVAPVTTIAQLTGQLAGQAAIFRVLGTPLGKPQDPLSKTQLNKISKSFEGFRIKGKRGQVSVGEAFEEIGKVIKKKKPQLKLVDKRKIQQAEKVKAELEKKLLKTETEVERLKILKQVFDRAKTQQQKDGFKILLKELVEKRIIKPEKIEIQPSQLPPITERTPIPRRVRPPEAELPARPLMVGDTKGIHNTLASTKDLIELRQFFRQVEVSTEFTQLPPSAQRNLQTLFLNREKQLERIELAQLPLGEKIRLRQLQRQQPTTLTTQQRIQEQKSSLRQKQKSEIQQRTKQRITSLQKQILNLNNAQRLAQNPLQKQLLKTRQQLILKQITFQRQLSKKQIQRIRRIQRRRRVPLRQRPRKPFLLLPDGEPKVKKRKRKPTPSKEFRSFSKTFPAKDNNFVEIAKGTKKQVKRKLLRTLDTTLRASGFIRNPKGRIVSPGTLPKGFRPGKTNRKLIVERRKFRLDSSTEKDAIQKAKRNKPFKPKKDNNFKRIK